MPYASVGRLTTPASSGRTDYPADVPDLYATLDYRAYLADWFAEKKAASPRYSHRAFARRVGEKSPSFLRDVIQGRRNLTPVRRNAVADVLDLDAEEQAWFALLVDFDQAPDLDSKQRIWDQIAATRRYALAKQIEGASYRYLAHWYYPAIRELARRPDFRDDPAWIAEQLRPAITADEAREALDALFELGFLVREGDRVVQSDGALATPREVRGLAADAYHRGMLELAKHGIRSSKAKERHYIGVTVCISEALVPTLKQELNLVASRLLDMCETEEAPSERVYQLQLTLLPLSEGPCED